MAKLNFLLKNISYHGFKQLCFTFNNPLRLCLLYQSAKEEDPGPRESVFQFEDMDLLPLRDIGILGNSSYEFGFTIGPVCFS